MMFSTHMDMIYKNIALQGIFVKLLFIEYRLSKNSGIHHQFRMVARGKKSAFWLLPLLS